MNWITDVEFIAEWLRSWGAIAVILSILLNIFISVTGVLPSIFLSGANAVVFGLFGGFIISFIGEVVGATIAFLLYRLGVNKSKKWNKLSQLRWISTINQLTRLKKGIALILLRVNPLLPSGIVNFGASLTNISFIDFIIATFIGKAPALVFETFVGHDVIYFTENKYRLIIAILLGVAFFAVFTLQNKNKRKEWM